MAGKHSVSLCHVEQTHMRTLGETQYVPDYPGVNQRATAFPHQRFPTRQTNGGNGLSGRWKASLLLNKQAVPL